MGEYAKYKGSQIKIGTCEDMYYLRWTQRGLIQRESGSVNVWNATDLNAIRFRFPWPDEDHIEPGAFEDFNRSLSVSGFTIPDEVDHHNVQFSATYPKAGYLLSIPCPESKAGKAFNVHKNGWRGDVHLYQQALRAGKLVSIFRCGGCDSVFRIEDVGQLAGMLAELRKPTGRGEYSDTFSRQIADRIEIGYHHEDIANLIDPLGVEVKS